MGGDAGAQRASLLRGPAIPRGLRCRSVGLARLARSRDPKPACFRPTKTCSAGPCPEGWRSAACRTREPSALRGLPWWRRPGGQQYRIVKERRRQGMTRDSFADASAEPYWVSPAILTCCRKGGRAEGMGRVDALDPGTPWAPVAGGSGVRPGSMEIGYACRSGTHNGVPFFLKQKGCFRGALAREGGSRPAFPAQAALHASGISGSASCASWASDSCQPR